MVLRNVVPRQGTETKWKEYITDFNKIEKCSSPTGDGNNQHVLLSLSVLTGLRNVVPRQGTETTSGVSGCNAYSIEKCSSPTGDGNNFSTIHISTRIKD